MNSKLTPRLLIIALVLTWAVWAIWPTIQYQGLSEVEKESLREEGKLEIQRMKEQASFAMKQEQRKAEDDLRRWIAEESVKLAEGTLKKQMNQNEQKKLVKNFMDQLNQSKGAA